METKEYFIEKKYEKATVSKYSAHKYTSIEKEEEEEPIWRIKDKMKTISVALVVCLNIGVDPPDIVKINPCARMECWTDPFAGTPLKALENAGKALQAQYERWQPRARYKLCLDPAVDDVKKACVALRKNARDERILLHYNGHGVPKPTANGEIWVFNKNFTQYIPISIYDLQQWIGSPSIFVYDCSAAGHIVKQFNLFAIQRQKDHELIKNGMETVAEFPPILMNDCIQLAACHADETLPMNPNLPADLFTSCLTTPIEIALRCFLLQNPLLPNVTLDMVQKIPGKLSDRRTPLGELNWIFTAITDTIAWNVFPKELFQKLFRQDLLVASLLRNYLLADRIIRTYGCTPISQPELPTTHQYFMWDVWDLTLDLCLRQLPTIIEDPSRYKFSDFFSEQLTAFEVWLEHAVVEKSPPQQLPVVLQVLLSQGHRLRALQLLSRFLDTGPESIKQALAVGIFPYILKLLQSPALELREVLTFIWGKVLSVDRHCQPDLIKDNGHKYFIHVLNAATTNSYQKALATFVLAVICDGYQLGQIACYKSGIFSSCYLYLNDSSSLLRKWSCLCLAKSWENFDEAKQHAYKELAHERLISLMEDRVADVRAAAIYALATLLGSSQQNAAIFNSENIIAISLMEKKDDPIPMVRKEVAFALSHFGKIYENKFKSVALEIWEEERQRCLVEKMNVIDIENSPSPVNSQPGPKSESKIRTGTLNSLYICIWKALLILSVDPQSEISEIASLFIDSVIRTFLKTGKVSVMTASSSFFSWSCEYFSESSKKADDNRDINKLNAYQRRLKSNLHRSVMQEVTSLEHYIGNHRHSSHKVTIKHSQSPIISTNLYPFEDLIAVADERGIIGVYDTGKATKIQTFSNRNSLNVKLSSFCLINSFYNPTFLTGTTDCVIRLWRMSNNKKRVDEVTSWRMFAPMMPLLDTNHPFLLDWNQHAGIIAGTSSYGTIRLWDASADCTIRDMQADSDGNLVQLVSDKALGNVYAAGYKDGVVRFFDSRIFEHGGCIATNSSHRSSICNLIMQEGGYHRLVSGSLDGQVHLWDIGNANSIQQFTIGDGEMMTMTAHNHLSLIASGSREQAVNLYNFNGESVSTLKHYEGFFGERISPATCLTFHQFEILLAVGTVDSLVAIYV